MDARFRDDLVAAAVRYERYGDRVNGPPVDCHDDTVPPFEPVDEPENATGSHWDV